MQLFSGQIQEFCMAIANQSAAADHVTSLASADWCILGQMFKNVLTCGLSLSRSLDDHGFSSNDVLDKSRIVD